jgi:hypothetical protein
MKKLSCRPHALFWLDSAQWHGTFAHEQVLSFFALFAQTNFEWSGTIHSHVFGCTAFVDELTTALKTIIQKNRGAGMYMCIGALASMFSFDVFISACRMSACSYVHPERLMHPYHHPLCKFMGKPICISMHVSLYIPEAIMTARNTAHR